MRSHGCGKLRVFLLTAALAFGVLFGTAAASDPETFDNLKDAENYLHDCMVDRETEISFRYAFPAASYTDGTVVLDEALLKDVFSGAEELHYSTVDYDYLKSQTRSFTAGLSAEVSGDGTEIVAEFSYSVSYYSTREQEAALSEKLEKDRSTWAVSGTELQKFNAVCDYIMELTTYADGETGDPASHSCYSAVLKGKAVCQGYAALLYRLLSEQGIDCRIITGTASGEAHAWNIVKIGGVYYNADLTWEDSCREQGTSVNRYLLKSPEDFDSEHVRDAAYRTESFMKHFPMASVSLPEENAVSENTASVTEEPEEKKAEEKTEQTVTSLKKSDTEAEEKEAFVVSAEETEEQEDTETVETKAEETSLTLSRITDILKTLKNYFTASYGKPNRMFSLSSLLPFGNDTFRNAFLEKTERTPRRA